MNNNNNHSNLLQKSKSKKQIIKHKSSSGNISSRALLQLSSITCLNRSHDKNILTQRAKKFQNQNKNQTFHNHTTINNYNAQKKQIETSFEEAKKKSQKKESSSLSSKVLKQLMNYPNRESNNKQYFKKQYEYDSMVILNKNNLMCINKNKTKQNIGGISQKNQTKKLCLNADQNKHCSYKKSRDVSSIQFSHFQKSQSKQRQRQNAPIICSIQINCLQNEQKQPSQFSNTHMSYSNNYSIEGRRSNSSQKQYLQKKQAKSSNHNSRRSSINLFSKPQFHEAWGAGQSQQIKQENQYKVEENLKSNNFQNYHNKTNYRATRQSQKYQAQKETKQNQTQITPRQKQYSYEQPNQKYEIPEISERSLLKLEQLQILEQKISKQAGVLSKYWDVIINTQNNLKNLQNKISSLQTKHNLIKKQLKHFNQELFQQNKIFIECKKLKTYNSNGEKYSILLQIDRIHNDVKKKVFKKDLQDIMIFNMKVVLPSHHELNSTINTIKTINSLNSTNYVHQSSQSQTQSFLCPNIIGLYEQVFAQKASKKYGMILKKEINNMNMYDCKTMNDYLKRLCELEINYNKLAKFNMNDMVKNEEEYLQIIQKTVQKIQTLSVQQQQLDEQIQSIRFLIADNQRQNSNATNLVIKYMNQISQNIQQEYHQFTQVMLQTNNSSIRLNCSSNQTQNTYSLRKQRCLSCKSQFVSFQKLTQEKYQKMFDQYEKIKQQKSLHEQKVEQFSC